MKPGPSREGRVRETLAIALPIVVSQACETAIYVLINAGFVVFIGALRGAGDTFWAMAMAITAHWMMVLVLGLVLRVGQYSAESGWSAVVGVFVLFFLVIFRRYRAGHWRSLRMVEPA